MELNKIKVEGFKGIEAVELNLKTVNILVGTNGSGKSSILQACHLAATAIRQASRMRKGSTAAIPFNELEYLPTADARSLGHFANWGNKADQPGTEVRFDFESDAGEAATAECSVRLARNNSGLSVSGEIDAGVQPLVRKKGHFFTAYIPGLSGIPNNEAKLSRRIVLRGASSGDSNVFLRNILLLLKDTDGALEQLEAYVGDLFGEINLNVDFDEDADLVIRATAHRAGHTFPLELAGTGVLQLIQVFAYLLLFKPNLLLIDEPDVHLHPSVQERFLGVLSDAARTVGAKVILSTHSPYIVRGAGVDSAVFWVSGGELSASNKFNTELALGWGAMGKRVLLITEDQKVENLRSLLDQWPQIERQVSIVPGRGYGNLPSPEETADLFQALGQKLHVVVHRDRDAMTDDEVGQFEAAYNQIDGVSAYVTDVADIEEMFLSQAALSALTGNEELDLNAVIDDILGKYAADIEQKFLARRRAIIKEFHAEGGGPAPEDVKAAYHDAGKHVASGKFLFKQVCNQLGLGGRHAEVIASACTEGVGDHLRYFLNRLLAP